jgi:hypothetical protein
MLTQSNKRRPDDEPSTLHPRRSKRKTGQGTSTDGEISCRNLDLCGRQLRADLVEFFNEHCKSKPEWEGVKKKDGEVHIKRGQFEVLPEHRKSIQTAGKEYGCHTCGSRLVDDNNQPWTGDHNPPTQLNSRVKEALFEGWAHDRKGWRGLLAQCDKCSSLQGGLVSKLNIIESQNKKSEKKELAGKLDEFLKDPGLKEPGLPPEVAKKIIKGGRGPTIGASGSTVTQPEGLAIQKEGLAEGCHSCDSRVASHTFHADHVPPAEFHTNYMEEVCNYLNMHLEVMDLMKKPLLRPQCKRCSGAQGGAAWLAKRARDYGRDVMRIAVYK